MTTLEKKVWKKLEKVLDPELNVPIVELGLVYKVKVKEDKAKITMTLTSVGCPLFGLIEETVKEKIKELEEINNVEIDLTFDPPWTMEKMSEKAKLKLGLV